MEENEACLVAGVLEEGREGFGKETLAEVGQVFARNQQAYQIFQRMYQEEAVVRQNKDSGMMLILFATLNLGLYIVAKNSQ